jgi:hypothetical protein
MKNELDGKYFFLSFRDVEKNRNLGACVVFAPNSNTSLNLAWHHKINPGGEVLIFELTEKIFQEQGMELNRLYSREELRSMDFKFIHAVNEKDK